jgi:hypothetical protein
MDPDVVAAMSPTHTVCLLSSSLELWQSVAWLSNHLKYPLRSALASSKASGMVTGVLSSQANHESMSRYPHRFPGTGTPRTVTAEKPGLVGAVCYRTCSSREQSSKWSSSHIPSSHELLRDAKDMKLLYIAAYIQDTPCQFNKGPK